MTNRILTCRKGSPATTAGEAALAVGLAEGGDDLALDVGAALCALGAVGAVVALRAEVVAIPWRIERN